MPSSRITLGVLLSVTTSALAQPAPAPPDKVKVTVFGRVQLLVWNDPQNTGDVPDSNVMPAGSLEKEWNSSIQLNLLLGGRFTYAKPIGGFKISGVVRTAVEVRRIFNVNNAGFILEHEDNGIKIAVGKFVQPTLSALTPSTFHLSTNFYLQHATTGAYVGQTAGRLLWQVGFGRPELPDFTDEITPTPRSLPVTPFAEGRLGIVIPEIVGELPASALNNARPAPLTVTVSGAIGKQRVGVGEKAAVTMIDPAAHEPEIEDVLSWIASTEVIVPVWRLTLAGELYYGIGANAYNGAFRQRPRVDPVTGRHTPLISRGGWMQLNLSLPAAWNVLAMVGLEQVTHRLDEGIAIDGPLRIEENRLLLGSVSKNFPSHNMHVGVQVQRQETRYLAMPTGTMYAVLGEASINF